MHIMGKFQLDSAVGAISQSRRESCSIFYPHLEYLVYRTHESCTVVILDLVRFTNAISNSNPAPLNRHNHCTVHTLARSSFRLACVQDYEEVSSEGQRGDGVDRLNMVEYLLNKLQRGEFCQRIAVIQQECQYWIIGILQAYGVNWLLIIKVCWYYWNTVRGSAISCLKSQACLFLHRAIIKMLQILSNFKLIIFYLFVCVFWLMDAKKRD